MDKEKRLNVLLKSFETLYKNGFIESSIDIPKIIGQISEYDIHLAFELWYKIVKENVTLLNNNKYPYYVYASRLTASVFYDLEQACGEKKVMKLLYANKDLSTLYLKHSLECSCITTGIPCNCLERKMYEEALYFFDLLTSSTNKVDEDNDHKKISQDKLLYEILNGSEHSYFTSQALEIMYSWADKITDSLLKARIDAHLISLEDYHDKNYDWCEGNEEE